MGFIGKIITFIIEYKKRIFIGIVLYVFFVFALFPFGDLGNFITAKVAQLTRNQVFVKFETLDLALLPTPNIEATNVKVQGMAFPLITADKVNASPSLLGLISFNPGVDIDAEGLMGGDVNMTTRTAGSTAAGVKRQDIRVNAESINLKNLSDTLLLPMDLDGKMNLKSQTTLDLTFIEQPNGVVDLNISDLNLTSAMIATPIGPLNFPDTKVKSVELKGNMNKGEFTFEKAVIGTGTDELFAQIKGTMNLNFQTQAQGQVSVVPGAFDLTIQIKAKPAYLNKAGLFLGFLDSYKKKESATEGNEYLFRMTGQNFFAPPRMSPVSTF